MAVTRQQLIDKVAEFRANYAKLMAKLPELGYEVAEKREIFMDLTQNGLTRAILYIPKEIAAKPMPLILAIHGGAWVQGSADYHDGWCRMMAARTGFAVLNIDYKLAPEYPFPTAVDECCYTAKYVTDNAEELGIDPERIAVVGHNVGANLAANVTFYARDTGMAKIKCQVLDAGTVGAGPGKTEPLTYLLPGEELVMPRRASFLNTCYTVRLDLDDDRRVHPGLAKDVSGLPQMLALCGESDHVTPGQVEYANRVAETGTPVRIEYFKDCRHGFTTKPDLGPAEEVERAWTVICDYLKETL